MSLDTYNQKRDFSKTPEPPGRKLASKGHSYVIQKHEAGHLHYDFRLEVDGVLKSWAIPKGPSLDPKDKRLAVETEDHPLDYGDFEGVIPEPGYGAGTVMLWDTGRWQPDGDEQQALAKGKISFELQGKRLRGRWSLVKMHGRKTSGKEWLLVKQDDAHADDTTDLTERYQRSAVSRRAMSTIAKEGNILGQEGDSNDSATEQHTAAKSGKDKAEKGAAKADKLDADLDQMQQKPRKKAAKKRDAGGPSHTDERLDEQLKNLPGARRKSFPDLQKPQLATLYKTVPTGADWLHEIKYDGYRLLARKQASVQLITRNQKDWTGKFAVIAQALEALPEAILDGELVSLGNNGISTFAGLQAALSSGKVEQLVYYVFDVLYYAGYDLTKVPLTQRKDIAKAATERLQHPQILYSDHIVGEGEEVLRHACQHGLEGIISKDADSQYQSDRNHSWRKVKCSRRQELVIVGFTAPSGRRQGFGALLLGYYQNKKLRYAGKVGTGFSSETLAKLRARLDKLVRKGSPLEEKVEERNVTWVKPQLVAEVEFTEWTTANRLRHPAFLGLREDKPAQHVVREAPVDASAADEATPEPTPPQKQAMPAELNLSSPDKVLFPQLGVTKQGLAEYYLKVAEPMLPYVAGRPLSLVRCPQGHTRHCFFQKHPSGGFGDAVKLIEIEEKSGTNQYVYIDSIEGLLELVQMGTLEIHVWGSRVDQLDKPDTLIFDLDPGEGVSWGEIKTAAAELREYLTELGLVSFLRTTGGKGLHLVVPVQRRHDWGQTKHFCKAVADMMVARRPDAYIATSSKAKRKNKIFIDYLRNGRGATSVCNYSTRSKDGAPVAVPVRWDELEQLRSSQTYGLKNIASRLQQQPNPWSEYQQVRQSITQKMMDVLGITSP